MLDIKNMRPTCETGCAVGGYSCKRQDMYRIILVLSMLLLVGCDQKHDAKPEYGALPDRAVVASSRSLATRGLMWAVPAPSGPSFTDSIPGTLFAVPVVTVLVHGYNTPPPKLGAYFAGLIAYLRDDRGFAAPLVIYDWKSTARHWEEVPLQEQLAYIEFLSSTLGERTGGRIPGLPPGVRWESMQYTADRAHATTTAVEGLVHLLRQLVEVRPDVRINILAHSMGSQVVIDVLRQQTSSMSAVKKVVLLAPDVDAAVLQDAKLASIRHLDALHVFYSSHDEIVRMYSRFANLGFPRLGATGPSEVGKLPAFVHLHDVGETLGTSGVHGRYITREGAAALHLDEVLK